MKFSGRAGPGSQFQDRAHRCVTQITFALLLRTSIFVALFGNHTYANADHFILCVLSCINILRFESINTFFRDVPIITQSSLMFILVCPTCTQVTFVLLHYFGTIIILYNLLERVCVGTHTGKERFFLY